MKSFFTGSQVYGFPHLDSDLDLFILGTEADRALFARADICSSTLDHYPKTTNFRFENLNIVFTTSRLQYWRWKLATLICRAIGPIHRERAVRIHKRIHG